MAHLGWREDCKAAPCSDHCYDHFDSGGYGDETPAWARERKYATCKQFFEAGDEWCGHGPFHCRHDHTCAGGRAGESERHLKECFACVDDGNIWNFDIDYPPGKYGQGGKRATTTCTLGPENAEKKRKADEKERECDRQATEKKNQCLAQPALGSSLGIDGVHATSFTLGALVACTLGVVAYLVRRSRITKITDSSAYGATTVK